MPSAKIYAVATFLTGILAGGMGILLVRTLGENTQQAMNALVEADAALIGFLAIAVIFMLTSLQTERRHADAKMSKLIDAYQFRSKKGSEFRENDRVRFLEEVAMTGYRQEQVRGFAKDVLQSGILSLIILIVSIMFALISMSSNAELRAIGVYVAFGAMVVGVLAFLTIFLRYIDVLFEAPEKVEEKKNEIKNSQFFKDLLSR